MQETIEEEVKEEPKPDIELVPLSKPQFEKYKNQTHELLSTQIKPSQTISELINDSLLQEWVRQGIEKHRDKRETCAFCGRRFFVFLQKFKISITSLKLVSQISS